MVNRRLLRTKAFQTLYAFRQAERANFLLASDQISEIFLPNLDSMIPKEEQTQQLEGLRQLAELYFTELYTKQIKDDEDTPPEAKNAAKLALASYRESVQKDRTRFTKIMVNDVEGLYNIYLRILLIIKELGKIAVWDEGRRYVETDIKTSRLAQNQVMILLTDFSALETECIRHDVKITTDYHNTIKKLFIDVILPDPDFQKYLSVSKPTFEDDLQIINHLLKTFVLKHYLITDDFEEKDINWNENKDVLKSLAVKTFKITEGQALELQPLALNWEDDKYYFLDIFNNTLDNDEYYEKLIVEQTQNWEADRLAMTDVIIMKMALAEMINFPSIPTKVTINEFIELAKNYSTPKSGNFVNGLLDKLSVKLQAEGVIRKSGRGLIDNK
jgi:transcription antitermination protein NusB